MVTDNSKVLDAAIKALTSREVLVGVPDTKAGRRKKKEPINNAALAYIHDKGSPSQNIPPRPFMGPGVQAAKVSITKRMENTGKAALRGDKAAVEKGLNAVGLVAVSGIRGKITSGPFTPLKPATIAARKRRGRTGDKPLIDTGQLRNSISYVIRNKKK